MTASPPLLLGAVHDTTDWRSAKLVASTLLGAPGTVAGTTDVEAADAEEVPDAFVAVTLKV
jgi:hypothetical protein